MMKFNSLLKLVYILYEQWLEHITYLCADVKNIEQKKERKEEEKKNRNRKWKGEHNEKCW